MKKSIFLKTILAAYVGLASSVFADANIFRTMQFENEQPARRGNITLIRKSDLDAGVDNPFILTTTGTSNGAYQFQNVPTGNGINSNSTTIDYNMNVFTPNGSRGFSISANGTIKSIDLFNYSGQKLQTIDFNNSGSSNDKIVATVDLNGYASSVYFASLSRENGDTQTAKIVYDNTIGIRGIKNPPSLNVLINSSSKLNNSKGNNKILDNLPPYAQLFLENYEDLLVYPGVDSAETNANFYQVLEASDEPGATQFTPEINELYIQDGDDFGTDWVSKLAQVRRLEGKFSDVTTQEPLSNYTVSILSNDYVLASATTDSNGEFSIPGIPCDNDKPIVIKFDGGDEYWSIAKNYTMPEVTTLADTLASIIGKTHTYEASYPGTPVPGVGSSVHLSPVDLQQVFNNNLTEYRLFAGPAHGQVVPLGDASDISNREELEDAVDFFNENFGGDHMTVVYDLDFNGAVNVSDEVKNNYNDETNPFPNQVGIKVRGNGSDNISHVVSQHGPAVQSLTEMSFADDYTIKHEAFCAASLATGQLTRVSALNGNPMSPENWIIYQGEEGFAGDRAIVYTAQGLSNDANNSINDVNLGDYRDTTGNDKGINTSITDQYDYGAQFLDGMNDSSQSNYVTNGLKDIKPISTQSLTERLK